MNGRLTQRAVQTAYRKTRRGGLAVLADFLQVKVMELAKWIAEAIRYETFRYRREHGKSPSYRLILKMVLGSAGPRAEGIRQELIAKHLIKVPTMAERGSQGGQAEHTKPYGWPKDQKRPYQKRRTRSDKGGTHCCPKPKTKQPISRPVLAEQQLKVVFKTIPLAGTLITDRERGKSIKAICFELRITDNREAWQALLRFHDLTNHPLFKEE